MTCRHCFQAAPTLHTQPPFFSITKLPSPQGAPDLLAAKEGQRLPGLQFILSKQDPIPPREASA